VPALTAALPFKYSMMEFMIWKHRNIVFNINKAGEKSGVKGLWNKMHQV
jgi:hypothetical protein